LPSGSEAATVPITVPAGLFSLTLKLWLLTTGARFLPGPLAAKASLATRGMSRHTANSMMLAYKLRDMQDFGLIVSPPSLLIGVLCLSLRPALKSQGSNLKKN
jgi:hypothetical protein